MDRRIVLKVALTLLLVSTLILVFNVQISSASGTVYIRVDGSIDPPSANITSADNVTYALVGDVNDSVVVQRANIALDGAGYTVQGAGSGIGINVTGVSNVTVKNCLIKSFRVGICFDVGADSGIARNNTVQGISGGIGEDAIGILLKSNYNTIFNNTISSLTGGTGAAGGFSLSGGSGGISVGVYLLASSGNNLTSNAMVNLTGGTGGTGGYIGSGGSGGISVGVYLLASSGNNLTSNAMVNLAGGTGGTGGSGGSGGSGGISAAVWLDTASYDNKITALTVQGSYKAPDSSKWNTIEGKPIFYFYNETSLKVSGFNVTTRTAPILIGGSTVTGNPGGAGGISTGLALINTTNSIIENNTVSGFNGMPGGTGGSSLSGGSGGISVGVYLSASSGNNLTSNAISGLTGGTGGAGGYHGSGGSGGTSAGICSSSSTNNNLTSNAVTNVTGGTGGTGGIFSSGGSGGISVGVYLSASSGNNLTSNAMSVLTGGTGGTNGPYGSAGSAGTSYSLYLYQSNLLTLKRNTLETADYGLYLYSSNYSTIYHNNFIGNASRITISNSNNTWDNGYPSGGNYWSNYTGADNCSGPYQNETGSDGIGDTTLQIDQYNKDNYPLMSQSPRHEIAITNTTVSTTEAYAGQNVVVNVTVKNWGSLAETFNVTTYYDSTVIGTQGVSGLAPNTETLLVFSWNTTNVGGGYYTIFANTSAILGETYTSNNVFTDGIVKITSPVRIVELIPCNQTGYAKDTFQQGTIAYFKVTINSTALIPQNTLITINLYDNSSITTGVVSIQGPTWPGTSTIIFGLPIPSTATTGTATVYANAYTDWPSQGGFPHCPEVSATLEITGP